PPSRLCKGRSGSSRCSNSCTTARFSRIRKSYSRRTSHTTASRQSNESTARPWRISKRFKPIRPARCFQNENTGSFDERLFLNMIWLTDMAAAHPVAHAMLVLAVVAVLGLALGSIRIRGVGLGIAGVLFAGIFVAHFGHTI